MVYSRLQNFITLSAKYLWWTVIFLHLNLNLFQFSLALGYWNIDENIWVHCKILWIFRSLIEKGAKISQFTAKVVYFFVLCSKKKAKITQFTAKMMLFQAVCLPLFFPNFVQMYRKNIRMLKKVWDVNSKAIMWRSHLP